MYIFYMYVYKESEEKIDEQTCPRSYNYKNTKHILNVICCFFAFSLCDLKAFCIIHLVKVFGCERSLLKGKG